MIRTSVFPYTVYVHISDINAAKAWCKEHIKDASDSRSMIDKWQWDCTHDISLKINNEYYRGHQFGFKNKEIATWFSMMFAIT